MTQAPPLTSSSSGFLPEPRRTKDAESLDLVHETPAMMLLQAATMET
jgi:hypothetical protein